jgi:outer membrane protein W
VLNADAKYIFLHTTANTPFGPNTVSVNVNPWLVSVGLGYRFGLPTSVAPVVAKY